MKTVLAAAALLFALLVAVVVVSGFVSPAEHVASVTLELDTPIDIVWERISDVEFYSSWRSDLETLELLERSEHLVGTRFREVGREEPVLFEILQAEPPRKLVSRIADDELPFGGQWTFELRPRSGGGTTLQITEEGFVRSFLFRALGPLFSKTATMELWLTDLAVSFGEPVRLSQRP
ncbi:MAG: SRPBCC family protein [Acidobacteriota bacterium]